MTLRLFARLINPGRPVIDRTNLTGAYDIHLEWWNDATSPADNSTASSLLAAIRKEMGLQLQPGRGPVEFLVIDHLERPAQN